MERSGELSGKRKAANQGTHADSAFKEKARKRQGKGKENKEK